MQYKNLFLIICILCAAVVLNGCATILTVSYPPEKETTTGATTAGEKISINYNLEKNGEFYTLYKNPICKEKVEIIEVSQKRIRGIIPAIAEFSLLGFGMVDWIYAEKYSKKSRVTKKLGYKTTGEIIDCGKKLKVPYANLVLQYPLSGIVLHHKTDMNANINLNKCIQNCDETQINIFVNEGENIHYITTIDKSWK